MMDDKADPIVALAKLLSIFVSAAVAEVIAPQLGAFLAGVVGGSLGVMTWRKCTRREAFGYVVLAGLSAWLFSFALARVAADVWPVIAGNPNLHQLAALVIGAVGHRWPAVGRYLGRLTKAAAQEALTRREPRE